MFQQLLHENLEVIFNLIKSDEAHFHLCGVVNKENHHFGATEQPSLLHKNPLHPEKVTVYCGVSSFGIFRGKQCNYTITVISKRYVEMLCNFFLAELKRLRGQDCKL